MNITLILKSEKEVKVVLTGWSYSHLPRQGEKIYLMDFTYKDPLSKSLKENDQYIMDFPWMVKDVVYTIDKKGRPFPIITLINN